MLMSLLIGVIIIGLLLSLVNYIPIMHPFKMVASIIICIIAIIWLCSFTGWLSFGPHHFR